MLIFFSAVKKKNYFVLVNDNGDDSDRDIIITHVETLTVILKSLGFSLFPIINDDDEF